MKFRNGLKEAARKFVETESGLSPTITAETIVDIANLHERQTYRGFRDALKAEFDDGGAMVLAVWTTFKTRFRIE